MNVHEQPVTASLVAEAQRLDFLPTYFGPRLMMRGEALVYAWLRRLCEHYSGAYWHYYTLSDGGFYMAPRLAESLAIEVDGNGFRGELSADAAGIVATLFALGQLAAEAADREAAASEAGDALTEVAASEARDALSDRFHFLRGFAAGHAEAEAILRAID
jgi:hypothetical protein